MRDAARNASEAWSWMSFFAATATTFASSSNCFATRSLDSYKATAASTTRAPTATATVRPTSARSRLGAKSWLRKPTKTALETGQDLLPFGSLHEVDESLDRRLHFGRLRVVHEEQGAADRVCAVREGLTRRGDVVDREHPHISGGERLCIHRHHPDRVLERGEGLQRLVDLKDLDRVLGVDRLGRTEEIRLERRARRRFGLAQQHADLAGRAA